jgi:hypothetical protein
MPIIRVPVAGSEIIASASVFKRRSITIAAGTQSVLNDLGVQVNNLPNAFVYVYQTSGQVGVTFQPFFAVDNTTNALPNWLPATVQQAVFLFVPLFSNFRVVATMLSAQISNQTGQSATFEVVVAASQ